MPGYKNARPLVEDSIKAGMVCQHCEYLLRDPLQTDAGLRVCKSCGAEIERLPGRRCAKCEVTMALIGTYPDRAIARDIAALIVVCAYDILGCKWSGRLSLWEEHCRTCDYKGVKCTFCESLVAVRLLDEHQRDCDHRVEACEKCGASIKRKDREAHTDECVEADINCQHCNTTLARKQLSQHLLEECAVEECLVCGQQVDRTSSAELKSTSKTKQLHLSDPKLAFKHHQSTAKKLARVAKQVTAFKADMDKALTSVNRVDCDQEMHTQLKERYEELMARMSSVEASLKTVKCEVASSRTQPIADKNLADKVKLLEVQLAEKSSLLKQQGRQIHDLQKVVEHIQSTNETRGFKTSESGASGVKNGFRGDQRFLQLETQIETLVRKSTSTQSHLDELELQLQASLASTHNGSFLWRIPNIARRKREAVEERITSIYSPPFYTGRNGYKLCVRAYLNGDGSGYNTHLSLFFVIMKGEFDNLLKWPFDHKVSMILVDQNHRKHVVQTFKPSPESTSFQKPGTDMNVASGCPQFAKLSIFNDTNYIKDDVMFIKCIVDTTRIFHP